MQFKQITIIGVGLIGGSIGLAVKKNRLAARIVGVTAHKATLDKARKRKAIDFGTLDLKKSVLNSDMVILATPVDKIIGTLKQIAPKLKKDCIVIDVASVKGNIVNNGERIIGSKAHFVGTHPMAGSEQRGVDKADSNLFKDAPCIITKTKKTDKKALKAVRHFWKVLGSKIYELSPMEHDKRVSNISHLPHAAAAALALTADSSSLKFASTGFGDTTRIASGDPALWSAILTDNSSSARGDIKRYLKQLEAISKLIEAKDKDKLKIVLLKAKRKRDKFISHGK
ncbi:MAG: prephenate dehydrogenase [Candidatus Omnitrophica bacterium]|nr:prephenate dehydrogenase [Candidatus Omnitrophota bacterium]